MEVNNDGDADIDDVTMVPAPDTDGTAPEEPANKKPTRGAQSARMVRDNSVDMLSDEAPVSSSQSNLKSPLGSNPPLSAENERAPLPPLEEQISRIESMAQNMQLGEGKRGYVISNEWLNEVQSGGDKSTHTQRPVDNRTLLQDMDHELQDEQGERFFQLKQGLNVGSDIQILPQEAWEQILEWYGMVAESPAIVRYCHNTSTGLGSEHLQFELYPPVFSVSKLIDPAAGKPTLRDETAKSIKIVASRSQLFNNFLKNIKQSCGIEMGTKVRLWRILQAIPTGASQQSVGMMTPAQSREPSPGLFADVNENISNVGRALIADLDKFVSLNESAQRELIDAKDETNNPRYNGRSSLDLIGLGQEGVLILEPQISGPAGGEWVSATASSKNAKKFLSANAANGKTRSNAGSGRSSPAPMGMMTRGRAQKSGRTRGTVGLGNLGNTCYMNSALQCVRSVKELTDYFLENRYKKELNPSNPLSHDGNVAKAYGELLHEIYNRNSGSSVSPRVFKNTIGRYGPSFSGYGQQDSQEFLLFLLDGLQEDLNRILKKPYIEKPDSTDEMVHNKEALVEFADKCWDIYKARNDSVITDLFAGMYKSTVTCPVCSKVSIIFDPFNNLTLQLPIENIWTRRMSFYPLNLRPIDVDVEIDKNSTIAQLIEYFGKKFSVDPKRLIVVEIYQNRFYKIFEPTTIIAEERIAGNDVVVVFELDQVPTNYPPPKKKKGLTSIYSTYTDDLSEEDDTISDRLLVPIFHRVHKEATGLRSELMTLFSEPSYIVLNKEEQKDYDLILKKVLARVAVLTTRTILDEEDAPSQEEDTDMVSMNNDTDSSDSRVQAHSIQGEEGMVDISMKDVDETTQLPHRSYPPPPRTSKPLPAMLLPEGYIVPGLRSLFEMKYFKSNEAIPTGWNTFQDANKKLPTIESRLPRSPSKPTEAQKLKRAIEEGEFGSEDELDKPPPYANSSTRLEDSLSSDEDDDLPDVQPLQAPDQNGDSSKSSTTSNDPDFFQTKADEPLIRAGEAIVLDWHSEGYDALFNGVGPEDLKGRSTDKLPRPVLPDPEQDKKSLLRKRREKDGVTLDDCLDEFGKEEILSENDAWYCPKCKKHQRASKKFELWKVPDVLVIHLKRFSAHGRLRDKLDLMVDFPTEGLDLSERVMMQDGKEMIYDLFAVDNHYGGLGGGHYTAFAQNFYDGSWYEYNDSMASKRNDPQSTVTPAAYLLFYRRRSETPLGGPFFENFYQDLENSEAGISSSQPASQDHSRTQSPSSQAGEGRRLGDASRTLNGSSSAYHGAGPAHQAGGGGLAALVAAAGRPTTATTATIRMARTTTAKGGPRDGDDSGGLPLYGDAADDDDNADIPMTSTEHDESADSGAYASAANQGTWSFSLLPQGSALAVGDKLRGAGDDHASSIASNSSTAVNRDDEDDDDETDGLLGLGHLHHDNRSDRSLGSLDMGLPGSDLGSGAAGNPGTPREDLDDAWPGSDHAWTALGTRVAVDGSAEEDVGDGRGANVGHRGATYVLSGAELGLVPLEERRRSSRDEEDQVADIRLDDDDEEGEGDGAKAK